MQRQATLKTDHKHSGMKPPYYSSTRAGKWKLPMALGLIAFASIWQFSHWLQNTPAPLPLDALWEQETGSQVSLPVSLPQNQAHTSLILPATLAAEKTASKLEWKNFKIKAGDSLGTYFQQAGLDSKALQEVLASGKHAQHLKRIYPGQTLKIQATEEGQIQQLHFDVDPLTTLIIHRQAGKLISQIEDKPIEKRVAFGGGKIFDSFFVAGKHAQLDDALIMELAEVFAYDIDFALDIKPNDHFKVLFEEYFVNGVKVGNGPIVAAEFVNNGKLYQAVRYTDHSGEGTYYSPDGHSLKKAFIRTPVQFTRISSPFNMQRQHPILHTIRAHKGVDYAAPSGTPVKAAGQGKVAFVGRKGGYGNTIVIQHGQKYTTLYAHLSKFASSLKSGHAIKQGQIIGYVGSTGLASGPHLHYEFRINGVHHNPLTVPLPHSEGVPVQDKSKFLAYSRDLLHIMTYQGNKVVMAAND